MRELNTRDFRQQSEDACRDAALRAILDHATRYFIGKRSASLAAFPGREEHFARARAARLTALSRLPELLEELEKNATAAGTQVHWTADAAEARAVITGIARAANARVIVKGKSMVTEEIALNPALEAAASREAQRAAEAAGKAAPRAARNDAPAPKPGARSCSQPGKQETTPCA